MSELTRADAIALYGNGERAWKRSEGYVEVDPRDLMRLCETFLNTRPAPSPSDAAGEPTHNDEQLKAFYYAMWTQARERYQKAEQRIKELEAPSPSDADEDDFALAPVKAGKPAPSPSREGWTAPHMCRDGHQEIHHFDSENEQCPLCMALSALRPAGDEGWEKDWKAHHGVFMWAVNRARNYTTPASIIADEALSKLPAAPATKSTIHRDSAPDGHKWVTETKEDK